MSLSRLPSLLLLPLVLVGQHHRSEFVTPGTAARPQPATLQAKVAALEYQPSLQQGQLSAPNRTQGLRLRWAPDGVEVESREKPRLLAKLTTTAFGRDDNWQACGDSIATQETEQVIRRWDGLREWWVNTPAGAEEGWTVERRPLGAGPLAIRVRVTSATVVSVGDGLRFHSDSGPMLAYGDVKAVDSRGTSLFAKARIDDTGFVIEVDDGDAEYPVTIDPLLTSAAWTAESNQVGANFGFRVASAGDVNGDGFSDVIVGANFFDNGELDEGRALLYLGGASGLSVTASWTAESNQAGAGFARSVSGAGDVNGDGFSDVIVGAPNFDNNETNEGRAFLYLGSATGLSAAPAWTAEINQTNAFLGASVAGAGDVNGDGYSDVIIGAFSFDNGETDEGGAFLYLGSAAGLSATPAWTAEPNQANAQFGDSLASAGDVNADGFSDVIIGAPLFDNGETNEGRAFLYLGSAAGLSATPVWTAEPNQPNAFYGAVAGAGDVNADGFSDVVVGAYAFDNGETNEGRAFVYLGSASGLSTGPAWTAESNQTGANFGTGVASAGDVNADGFSDVIVGATTFDNGQADEGATFLYLGAAAGLSATPAWTAESNQPNASFGGCVASAGDVNGDGFSDVIVGAFAFDNGETDEGRAFLFLGTALGPSTTSAWTAESNQASAQFAFSLASAGDVNGDGFSDVIIGANLFDNGEMNEGRAFVYLGSPTGIGAMPAWTAESNQPGAGFGFSVASGGDVNGDGFSDVVIGANLFANGQMNEGRAFLYLGSATGLSPTPAWTAESNQVNAFFGISVASAGDVNGDGFSDVIVGAPDFTNGELSEGRAFLYLGSATGLAATSTWTAESNQTYGGFGVSVASAGDVNSDGFSDVIVGAYRFGNGEPSEGRAFLYLGNASGLTTGPAWTAESNQANAFFGESVASAGDVNGDGFSDVIIGSRLFDNGESDEGRAFVYLGNTSGLSATPIWTAESNQAIANFGKSAASAGDVNGDGFSDVIVGANTFTSGESFEGRAFLYLGNASGLSATAAWTAEPNQVDAFFGWSATSAGDVNGDGFSDVIIGAFNFDNGESEEGRAFLYLGGDGAPGASRGLAQRFAGTSKGPGARFSSAPQFDGRVANSFLTLSPRFRLEVETKSAGIAFNGRNTQLSPFVPAGTTIRGPAPPLSVGRYRWRARVVSGDGRGRWVPFGGNPESETDFVVFAGTTDAGTTDAGTTDAGTTDAGTTDAGTTDAGTTDAGTTDAGTTDAGTTDAGTTDAGTTDAGTTDAGTTDAGTTGPAMLAIGCGCGGSTANQYAVVIAPLLLWRIRRRRRPCEVLSRSA